MGEWDLCRRVRSPETAFSIRNVLFSLSTLRHQNILDRLLLLLLLFVGVDDASDKRES